MKNCQRIHSCLLPFGNPQIVKSSIKEHKIRINDIYLSIQGEDLQTGLPTVFVRTARCNLRCKWCDTLFKDHSIEKTPNQVMEEVAFFGVKDVCITGGEPLMEEDMLDFLEHLQKKEYWKIMAPN